MHFSPGPRTPSSPIRVSSCSAAEARLDFGVTPITPCILSEAIPPPVPAVEAALALWTGATVLLLLLLDEGPVLLATAVVVELKATGGLMIPVEVSNTTGGALLFDREVRGVLP